MYLLAVASQVGYQNSGMTPSKRHMLAIRSTLKIDTPIAYLADDKIHCLVDPAYLRLLLEMANQKFHQNIKRMKIFEDAVQQELVKEDNKAKWESKEDRRERKRREGLEKKAAAQEKKKTEEEDDVADLLEESRIE
jgi:tRNA wybutosine-synthesizing protein 3